MRWWTHSVADVGDWYPGGLYGMALTVLLLGVAVGLLTQRFALYRIGLKFPTKKDKLKPVADIVPAEPVADEALPDLPSDALLAMAQQYMAAGDYRSAVREWLRVMVRDLVERGAIEHRPGWTVTELATAGGHALPPIAADLDEAARIFSDIWYGGRPAELDSAARMRDLQARIVAVASAHPPAATFSVEAT
ncbi:MAG: DUF4129 domain-containing protein [Stackebrandtia sp.]